ncbi:hypothetical protein GLOTRDRAFT_40659, partial [Gloeophyllum trabeum ATCC 11539]
TATFMSAPGHIFVVLFHRKKVDSFHWALAVEQTNRTFTKFHAKNTFGGIWSYECTEQDIFKDAALVALVEIGKPQSRLNKTNTTVHDLHELFKAIPMATPRADGGRRTPFNCIIWLRQAVRSLSDHNVISCNDAVALENECQRLAEEHAPEVLQGSEGYRVFKSTISM